MHLPGRQSGGTSVWMNMPCIPSSWTSELSELFNFDGRFSRAASPRPPSSFLTAAFLSRPNVRLQYASRGGELQRLPGQRSVPEVCQNVEEDGPPGVADGRDDDGGEFGGEFGGDGVRNARRFGGSSVRPQGPSVTLTHHMVTWMAWPLARRYSSTNRIGPLSFGRGAGHHGVFQVTVMGTGSRWVCGGDRDRTRVS